MTKATMTMIDQSELNSLRNRVYQLEEKIKGIWQVVEDMEQKFDDKWPIVEELINQLCGPKTRGRL